MKTHRPVALKFHDAPLQLGLREQRKPEKMNSQTVFGPQLQAPSWTLPRSLAEEAEQAIDDGNRGRARALLDDSFIKFADIAETVLIPVTMSEVKHKGRRARMPKSVWAPLYKKNTKKRYALSEDLTTELERARITRDLAIDLKSVANSNGICADTAVLLRRIVGTIPSGLAPGTAEASTRARDQRRATHDETDCSLNGTKSNGGESALADAEELRTITRE